MNVIREVCAVPFETDDRKEKILRSAESIMSRKRLADTKISEIAHQAGIADSVIYQYFKGKEDLLFAVTHERMKDVLFLLKEHLQGILDPASMISKLVWFYLSYHDAHPGYARTLLLQCRSSKDFYSTPGYSLIREFSRILVDILKKGVAEGVFFSGLNVGLARDIILGALDSVSINSLLLNETDKGANDHNDIMALIIPMLTYELKSNEERPKSERILIAAEKVFSEKGFNKATIAEIAKLAHVAEGTVYEYFETKEDLLFSIAYERFKSNLEELPEALELTTPLSKLRRLIRYTFSLFVTDKTFLNIFLFQLQLNEGFYQSKAFENFRKYYNFIENIIDQGKADGDFRSDVNSRVFRNMFLGAFSHMSLRWILLEEGTSFDKLVEIDEVTDMLSSAVVRHKKD